MSKQNGKKARPARVPVPPSRKEQHLIEQMRFLDKSVRDFDAGDVSEFRRMASVIRLLVHQTRQSHSLLSQLGMAEITFASYARPIDPRNLLSEFSLAMMQLGGANSGLKPILDEGPEKPKSVDFETWWNEGVLRDDHKHIFSRKDIVLAVANQDGGSHVDPEIDEAYHRLANENSIGWVMSGPDGEKPLEHIEKVYVRHITHELMLSVGTAWGKRMGNRLCDCGSGRKARYCCQKRDSE